MSAGTFAAVEIQRSDQKQFSVFEHGSFLREFRFEKPGQMKRMVFYQTVVPSNPWVMSAGLIRWLTFAAYSFNEAHIPW
jgi:hypothetical protein